MTRQVDLRDWRPGKGETGVVQYVEFDTRAGSYGIAASLLNKLPEEMQEKLHLDGCRCHADLSVLYELVHDKFLKNINVFMYLEHLLQDKYPEVFGKSVLLSQEFISAYSSEVRLLENFNESDTMANGYHAMSCPEPIILEPEDWTSEEWAVLKKLCGMTDHNATRMVLNVSSVEVYIEGLPIKETA